MTIEPRRNPHRCWMGLMLCLLIGGAGCHPVPQVISDPAVFQELDALYTAVTAHRADLLSASMARFQQLHQDHRLSAAGFQQITAIGRLAEAQHWEKAAHVLHAFMKKQRKPSRH